MFSPDSTRAPNVAIITIVCGWVFTAVATVSILLLVWSRRLVGDGFEKGDYVTFAAFGTTLALVAHTTWAVVDEGLGEQLGEVSKNQRGKIVGVGLSDIVLA